MMILAISHNTGDPTPHLQAEAARMAELRRAGLVELILLKADQSGAVLLMRTPDLPTARQTVDSLPLVAKAITSFELTEVIIPDSIPTTPTRG